MCARISARVPRRPSYTYTNPREKPEPPPISRRSARATPLRVNKLSRFIPFFHRRSRYIFPVRRAGNITRTAHACSGNREIRPSGMSASPSQPAKYQRPASVRKHSEFSQTEFPFCDAKNVIEKTTKRASLRLIGFVERKQMDEGGYESNTGVTANSHGPRQR